jgi:hypothetical protein
MQKRERCERRDRGPVGGTRHTPSACLESLEDLVVMSGGDPAPRLLERCEGERRVVMDSRWLKVVAMAVMVVALAACLWVLASSLGGQAEAESAGVRYQIEASGDRAWMVDSATGRVWLCEDGACREQPVSGLHPRPGG